MASMVKFRSCLAIELNNKPIIPGSFILCTDTGAMYKDNDNERIQVARAIQYFATERERNELLAPEIGILYIVLESGKIYIYNNEWTCINLTTEHYYIHNVFVSKNGSTSVRDSRVRTEDAAKFIPYPELYDIATAPDVTINCNCDKELVTITSNCKYDLNGIIEITTIE